MMRALTILAGVVVLVELAVAQNFLPGGGDGEICNLHIFGKFINFDNILNIYLLTPGIRR